jgi:hypothetical protein
VVSGAASGCSASPEFAPPNPYGDRRRLRRPRGWKGALPSDGDSNPEEGGASGVAIGVGEASGSGDGAPATGSALVDLGLVVMKEGSPDGAAASAPASLAGCG